ncbi:MAG: peptide deformylase [Gaiellaceae bacterium]|jgi:peptide deformylase
MPNSGQVKNVTLDAEHEARRRTALAQLRHYPDPVLRMRAREVEIFDEALAHQAERMIELMHDAAGVGLAANQVGILQRMFVIELGDEEPAQAIVNPRVTPIGDELESEEEGCLSLQGTLVPVERPITVRLEAQGVDGRGLMLELDGLPARAVQHEVDHLDGILTFDRTTPEARREALSILRPRVMLTPSR